MKIVKDWIRTLFDKTLSIDYREGWVDGFKCGMHESTKTLVSLEKIAGETLKETLKEQRKELLKK